MNYKNAHVVALLAVGLLGCPGRAHLTGGADAAAVDAGSADALAHADEAGVTDAAEPPLRSLGSRPLLGGMPVDNRFLDPRFTTVDGLNWIAIGGADFYGAEIYRLHITSTPDKQPALRIVSTNGDPVVVMGAAVGGVGPLIASVWLGRGPDVEDVELQGLRVSLVGLVPEDGDVAMDLSPEATPQVIEEITWQRYVGRIEPGPVAWTVMSIEDNTGNDLLVAGPVLVKEKQGAPFAGLPSAIPAATKRSISQLERRALAKMNKRLRDRLTGAHPAGKRLPHHLPPQAPAWLQSQ